MDGKSEFANDREMEIDSVPVPVNTETPAAIAVPTTTTSTTSTTTTTTEPLTTTTAESTTKPPRPLGPDGNPISKSAHKKQLKLQRFAETREQWKADKKRKLKERKQRDREEREAAAATGSKRKADDAPDEEQEEEVGEKEGGNNNKGEKQGGEPAGKKLKQTAGVKRVVEDITLILDCGFDEKMHEKEVVSMSSQLTRCYAFNRAAPRQFKLAVTSLNGRLLTRFQTGLKNQHLHWKGITFSDAEYEVNDETRRKLVYLTADAEETVEELEPGTSYIIGGIVDRNRYKKLCYNKAVAQGIRTAKLPIGDYIKMASRFVLTTNQVVEIMLKYLECRDWKEAFITVIPPRKQPAVKMKDQDGAEGKEGAADDETENGEVEDEGN